MTPLARLHSAADAVVRPLELSAAVVGATLMLGAMLLTSIDVVSRYVFAAPLDFAQYLAENYLLVGLMCMPLAWGFRAGGYIRVVGVVQALPSALGRVLLRAGLLAGAGYIALLAWLAGVKWWETWRDGSVDIGVIDWPVSWSWICVPIGLALLALRLLLMSIGPARELHFDENAIGEEGA